MPSPADTPSPAAAPDPGFDPMAFWIEHRSKIVTLVVLLIIGAAAYGTNEWMRVKKLEGARDLFSKAKTAADYRAVIAQYPGTTAAGDAHLLLGAALRKEGKFEESSALLRKFTSEYPLHPLISGAWTSIAANLEAEGKPADALAMYQKVATSYSNTFSAPVAMVAEARLLKSQGKNDEARKVYEQVIARFQGNPVAQLAEGEMRDL